MFVCSGANAGLDKARAFLEPIKKQFPQITYSDLWVSSELHRISQDTPSSILTQFDSVRPWLVYALSRRWADPLSRGALVARMET